MLNSRGAPGGKLKMTLGLPVYVPAPLPPPRPFNRSTNSPTRCVYEPYGC